MKQKNRVYENGLTFLKLRVPSLLTDGEPGYFYSYLLYGGECFTGN